jgi:hypothetical protein
VLGAGLSFRRAHHRVGKLVTEAAGLDPEAVAAGAAVGGGPAPASLKRALAEPEAGWIDAARRLREESRSWRDGERALDLVVDGVLAEELPPLPPRPPAAAETAAARQP